MTLNQVRDGLSGLPRRWKRALLIGFDALALLAVLWLSFTIRLGGPFTPTLAHIGLMLVAPVVAFPVFVRLGLYRAVIRYLPERALWTIIQAMMLATLLWVFVLFLAEATRFAVFPRTVPFFYFIFGTVVIAGSRFLAKAVLWLPERGIGRSGGVVIYGAGTAGTQLVEALRAQRASYVVAFLDDDRSLWGRDVAGTRVYPPDRLDELIRNRGVSEVILSIPSADAGRRARIIDELSHHAIKIRALPAIADLISGKYLISQLREIDIDDLLGRSAVPADAELMRELLADRVILVTGAGGSIGSELTRLIVTRAPKRLVLLEANEFALYEIERQLRGLAEVTIVPVLGSVTDARLVRRVLAEHGIEVIFHAAAHKHVPLVEANPLEGVRNNVLGTRTLVEAAVAAGVPRFGNVLGSNGSVVPLFREQIAAGGPVTLTDNRMTRYFMSIHEAAELIVQAGALAEGGEIFLLEMGEPVAIRELAENMIRLAGLSVKSEDNPQGDIAIVETGARPGEKLVEELFFDPANALRTSRPKILRTPPGTRPPDDLERALAELTATLEAEDVEALRRVLFGYVKA